MATFSELLEMLANPPEDGLPEDIATQLQTEYDKGIQEYTESAASALERATAADTAREAAEAAKLEAQRHNARLLKSIPANDPGDDDPGQVDTDTDPFGSGITLESMIEYK